jgi:uncharacterized pyridoxamine 5'-phosphate oxidase family protein
MIFSPGKRILVAPLDWGTGHAARCIPVIKSIIDNNAIPILGGSERVLKRLKQNFPELQSIHIPDIDIKYSRYLPVWLAIIFQVPKFYRCIKNENAILNKIITNNNIDIVISDNRYGLYSKSIPSIIITHQTNLQLPTILKPFKPVLNNFIKKNLKNFNEVWIPDIGVRENYSGNLSSNYKELNAQFIGVLSRFEEPAINNQFKYDVCIILSGPAPQPQVLIKKIIKNLPDKNLKVCILSSKKYVFPIKKPSTQIEWITQANDADFSSYIATSKAIITRAGYSTLMDLIVLKRKALLIPTPGQTEQEYLSMHFEKYFGFSRLPQRKISKNALNAIIEIQMHYLKES